MFFFLRFGQTLENVFFLRKILETNLFFLALFLTYAYQLTIVNQRGLVHNLF